MPTTWVDLPTLNTGGLLTADHMNDVRDNLDLLYDTRNYAEIVPHTEFSSNTPSIELASIPSTFAALRLRLGLRTDRGNSYDAALLTFNNSTTSSQYTTFYHKRTATTDVKSESIGTQPGFYLTLVAGGSSTANFIGSIDITIFNYASTSQFKYILYTMGLAESNATDQIHLTQGMGYWRQTAQIVSLKLTPVFGSNFTQGFYNLMGLGS